jgi:hypothetical protein
MTHTSDEPIREYKTICERFSEGFDREVNRYLKKGWQLYGSPFIGSGNDLFQIMVFKGD